MNERLTDTAIPSTEPEQTIRLREADLTVEKAVAPHREDVVTVGFTVDSVADEEHWEDVKRKLIAQVGSGNNPSIRITDADFNRRRELYLVHDHDRRDLHLGYAERTLQHLYTLWGRRVLLETQVNGKPTRLAFDEDGFDARLVV